MVPLFRPGWSSLLLTTFVVGWAFLLGGCAVGGGPAEGVEALSFAPSLKVDLSLMTRTPSGLYLQDLRRGEGKEVLPGQLVRIHFGGWLPDGTLFDATVPPAPPLTFSLGRGEVISGWDEGIRGMRVGGVRRLVVPPGLGYGRRGVPGTVPSNATLVFQIEVVGAGEEPGKTRVDPYG